MTYDQKLETMISAIKIEQERLRSEKSMGYYTFKELLDFPDSIVRLYENIMIPAAKVKA